MPNIYVKDETKKLIERVADADSRTQDGVISYLCKQRLKELGLPDDDLPSVNCPQCSEPDGGCQEKKLNARSARAG